MRTPKENKQKLRDRTQKSTAGTIPKAALKAAWLKTKEQSRTTARENDTDPRQQEPTDLAGSAAEQAAAFVRHTNPPPLSTIRTSLLSISPAMVIMPP